MRLEPALRAALRPAIGLAINKGGLAAWSPRALFAAGEQGAWYDPSDLSTLFQDAAGTIPVTAVGQPVGLVKDKSGRGNHASQATATARPTLQQDSGGRYYLQGDGVDDSLNCNGFQAIAATARAVILAGSADVIGPNQYSNTYVGLGANSTVGSAKDTCACTPSGTIHLNGTAVLAGASAQSVGAKNVMTYAVDALGLGTVRKNSVLGASQSVSGYSTTSGLALFNDQATNRLQGRIYGAIVIARELTTNERLSAERYLAARSGVTL